MDTRRSYGGPDRFRIAAALMVAAIHTSPLLSYSDAGDFFLTRIICRVAVPFFFMVTGQFVAGSFFAPGAAHTQNSVGNSPHCGMGPVQGAGKGSFPDGLCPNRAGEKLKKYLKKTAGLYGIAILLYLPIGIYAGHYQEPSLGAAFRMLVFDGTFYHLWYFPACMIGMILVYLMSRAANRIMSRGANKIVCNATKRVLNEEAADKGPEEKITLCLGTAVVLYTMGLLGDSYFGLVREGSLLYDIYMRGFQIFSYTRNGLFMAPIFLLLGAEMAYGQPSAGGKVKAYGEKGGTEVPEQGGKAVQGRKFFLPGLFKDYIGLGISALLMTAEAFTLRYLGWQRHDSMYVALIPTAVFLYRVLLSWEIAPSRFLRDIALWIYVLHPAVIVVVRGGAKVLGLTGILVDNSLLHYLAVITLSTFAAVFLAKRMEKGKKEDFHCGRAWIELDQKALKHNVDELRKRLPEKCRLMPALKADGYGHGALLLGRALNRMGVDAFCVASVKEGVELRKGGIKGEILILGYTHPKLFPLLKRYRLTQTVVDFPYAGLLNRYGKKIHVHIGVDTGMHRLGERSENVDRIYNICRMKNLIVDGIYTHLSADDTLKKQDIEFTRSQAEDFYELIEKLEKKGCPRPKIHLQSSYGVFNYPELAEDYARVGIALYGVLSTGEDTEKWKDMLRPVLSLKARIASVRNLYAGESAGYGLEFRAKNDMKIATLTIGYGDGLPRSLSGRVGAVLIEGRRAPIVGRICMDQTIVDVSGIPGVKAGDVAVVIGKSGDKEISVCDLAQEAGTITNEILSRLGARVTRIMA